MSIVSECVRPTPGMNDIKSPDVAQLISGVTSGDRVSLARAITLIESSSPRHTESARELLRTVMPRTGNAVRIGLTGIPGAGKSTFINAFGVELCRRGHRVAVLAIDPSSTLSRGSILGDKTRMEALAREANAFIRPSPSGGTTGGVAQRTREAMLLCEAAGFDVVLIETMGVGQSEVAVRAMVDFFAFLTITGGGDELQTAKRGVMELVDAIIVTKADGDNQASAEILRDQLETAITHLRQPLDGWTPRVRTCSSVAGNGLAEIWRLIEEFYRVMRASGALPARRQRQMLSLMDSCFETALKSRFLNDPAVARERRRLQGEVRAGRMDPTAAAELLAQSGISPC